MHISNVKVTDSSVNLDGAVGPGSRKYESIKFNTLQEASAYVSAQRYNDRMQVFRSMAGLPGTIDGRAVDQESASMLKQALESLIPALPQVALDNIEAKKYLDAHYPDHVGRQSLLDSIRNFDLKQHLTIGAMYFLEKAIVEPPKSGDTSMHRLLTNGRMALRAGDSVAGGLTGRKYKARGGGTTIEQRVAEDYGITNLAQRSVLRASQAQYESPQVDQSVMADALRALCTAKMDVVATQYGINNITQRLMLIAQEDLLVNPPIDAERFKLAIAEIKSGVSVADVKKNFSITNDSQSETLLKEADSMIHEEVTDEVMISALQALQVRLELKGSQIINIK